MKVVRCKNGHFFDEDHYKVCPHCSTPASNSNQKKSDEKPERSDRVMGMMISPFNRGGTLGDRFISEDPICTLVDDICPKDSHELESITNTTIPGIKTDCCRIMIPERFSYCPKCGLKLEKKENLLHVDIPYDPDQTCWICGCLESNVPSHQFCGNCGKKRPW